MKRAYSPKHGRTVDAADLTHADCRDDRVACEICGERAFKVERGDNASAVHYLSHHRRNDLTRDCEARIAARMTAEAVRASTTARATADRGQALGDRIDALARILAVQFPAVARHALKVSRRIDRETHRTATGRTMPGISLHYGSYASMFQLAARMDGATVRDDDLLRWDYGADWVAHVATLRRWGLDSLRRTVCTSDPRQEAWARDATALVCVAQSDRALTALVRHAWSDLCVNGMHGGSPHHAEAVRRLTMQSDGVKGINLHTLMDGMVAGPIAMSGDTYWSPAAALLVARMRDVLREIDYSAPVPAAGTVETAEGGAFRLLKESGRAELLAGVGGGAVETAAMTAAASGGTRRRAA